MLPLYDSHCHLDFVCFDEDRAAVLASCKTLGIEKIVIPGTQACGWQKQLDLTAEYDCLAIALGLHPYFLDSYHPSQLERLALLLQTHENRVIALGEIGLDFSIKGDQGLQQQVFEAQLSIANDLRLPVIIHHRQSHNQLIRTLKKIKVNQGGVIHAFSGSLQEAHSYLQLGFKLGIGGTITYERARKTRQTVAQLPLESFLLETDSPDMPLSGFQGQRNTPEHIPTVMSQLADLTQTDETVVARQCWLNFINLFSHLY